MHPGWTVTMDIDIRLVDSWPREDIVRLYESGGWWNECYDPSGIDGLIDGSFAFAVAVDRGSGRAVGMGRAISDGSSDAYIQDVVVLDGLRGKGIGSDIIRSLVEFCRSRGLVWIGLIAEGGSERFYRKLGFDVMPGHTPMLLCQHNTD